MQIYVKRQGLGADPEERRMVREEEKATVGEEMEELKLWSGGVYSRTKSMADASKAKAQGLRLGLMIISLMK